MTSKRLISIISALLLAIPTVHAQLDTEFWFAIPEVNRYHQTGKGNCPCNDGTPTRFRITTLDRPVTVTISMPANEANFNGGNPLVINIPANSLYKLDLAPYISDEIQKQHPENPNYQAKVSMENKLRWCQSNYPGNGRNQYINRNNKGILIQSTDLVNIYYEISLINNKELLTLKGKNALGNKFFVPFQMNWNITDGFNHPNRPYRAFDIVATENNTHVRITIPNELAIYTINNSAKDNNNKSIQSLKNKIYDIYLNRGETAIIAPYASRKIDTKWNPSDLNNESTYQTERVRGKQLIGAKVEVIDDEGYKKIAIQTHEDMVNSESKLTGGKSVDYVADQLVNFECLGTDYAVIKGHAEDGFYYSNEYVIAIATENNTKLDVWFDNNNSISYNLNESEWKSINIPANANVATLQATKPIVVFHQSGVGIQFAGAVVPTISRCTGSTKVAFNRTMAKLDKTQNICQYPMCPGVDQITEGCKINGKIHECTGSDFHLFLNILVYKGGEDGFKLLRNGVDVTAEQAPVLLPANANTTFKDLPNASGNFAKYRYARLHLDALDQDVAYTLVNTKNVFHLGVINGRGGGMIIDGQVKTANSDAFYGYFSDFAAIKVEGTVNGVVGNNARVCYGDPLQLYGKGGTIFEWHRLNDDGKNADENYLVDNLVQNPHVLTTLPVGMHRFKVITSGFCDLKDSTETRVRVGQLVKPGIRVEPEFQCGTDVRFDFQDTTVSDLSMIFWYVHEVGSSDVPPGVLKRYELLPTADKRGFSYNAVNHTNDIKYFDVTRIAVDPDEVCEHEETRRVRMCDIEFEANRTPQDPNGCHPLTVDFVSTYLSGYIGGLSYEWDFDGDGTTDHSEANPTYIYRNFTGVPQTYTPTLTVRNDQGCSQTIELNPITVQPWIHANFAIDTVEGCSPFRQTVVANSMGGVASHIWDKTGTGYMTANSQKGMPSDWVFTSTAANTITTKLGLRVTTENGLCHDTYEQPVTVYPTPTTAAVMTPLSDNKCSPLELKLEGRVTGPGKNFRWEESTDGGATWITVSNAEDVVNENGDVSYKIYNYNSAPEMHRFRFTVSGDYGCGTTLNVGNVTVQPFIDAQFSMDTFVCAPDRLTANIVLYGGANYYDMNWGDGTTPNTYTGITPPTALSHDYANTTSTTGRYDVTLTVRNAAGCERQHTQPVYVFPQVIPDFTPDYAIDCSPLHVEFKNTSKYVDGTPLPNALYEWDFGNGNSSVLEHPEQDFNNEEVNDVSYTIRLVTRSEHGCYDTVRHSVTVQPSVTAYMAVDSSSGCSPLKVKFDYKVLPSISSYRFIWDDGSAEETVSAANATGVIEHTFINETDASIVRNVRMVASNTNCNAEIVIPITVHAAITASYAQGYTTGCSPLEVQFTDGTKFKNGVAVPDALYYWEFGDGNSSIEPSPVHTFENNGNADITYTITQRVTTQQGCVSNSTSTVTVSPFIAAQLAINRCEGCTPLNVDFTYPTHPSVERYEFSWGDGQTTSLTAAQATGSISHTFVNTSGQPENRTVRLTISNAKCTDYVALPIRVYPEIEAGFSVDKPQGCTDLTVGFTNTSRFKGTSGTAMGADDAEYYWDFGDGTQSTEFQPTHVFKNKTGGDVTYTITLKVRLYQTNLNGERVYTDCQSTFSSTVTVYPFVNATVTLTTNEGCSPLPVEFTHTEHDGAATYTFNWDDGTASTTIAASTATGKASHTFVNQTGTVLTRTVTLVVSNGKSGEEGCTVTDQVQLTVYPEVQADFVADKYEGCTDLDVQLTNTSVYRGTSTPVSNHLSYWKFGDGASAEEHTPAHTYQNDNANAPKICPTELRVRSEYGCEDVVVKNIEVYNRVESHFTLDQPSECTPFDVTFTSKALGATSFEWSFGGAPGLTNHPMTANGTITRTFSNPSPDEVAYYDVTLSVTNSKGCPASETQTVTVFPQVIAAFDKNGVEGCSGLTVDFNNLSTGGSLVSVWDFGDNNSVSNDDKTPVQHTYHNTTSEAKVYTVVLTTINPNGCRDVTTQEVTVHPKVVSDFQLDELEGCTPFRVPISNLSTTNPYTTYQWTFGDGTSSTQMQPGDHTYVNSTQAPPVVEKHTLTLQVRYERNGTVCLDSKSAEITVNPHIYPEFTGNFEGCHQPNGLLVQFQNQTVAFNDATTRYIWYLGDPTATDHTMDHDPVHLYRATTKTDDRIYDVKLVSISEHGCKDSVEHQVTVHPRPQAGLELLGDDHASCPPFNVEMANISQGTDLTYHYTFGDGTDSTTMSKLNMRHAYQNNTTENVDYTMTLHVTTKFGCEDQVQQTVKVYPAVQVSFTLSPEAGCAPHEVQFDASATLNAYEYRWDFDDGITSSTLAPEHSFENLTETDKIYNVTLRAASLNGCKDELTKPVTVYATPQANFAITPPQNTFPNSTFLIDNKSNPASPGWKYSWEFGDGYTSSEKNPNSHTYLTWGPREDGFKYEVKLRIESPNCWSTTSNTIWLYAPRPIASFKSPIYKACSPLEVNLINNSKYGTSYFWDFGDGTTSTEFAPYHVFEYDPNDTINNGNYLVSLTVYGDGGMHFEQQQFQVYQNPTAAFSTSPTTGVIQLPNAVVGFINESQNYDPPLSYWDFGDGTSEYAASPRHEYMGMGEYKVSLWVYQTYDDGTVCADSLSRNPAVWVQAPGTISFPNAFKPSHEGSNGGVYEPNDIKNQVFHPLHKGVDTYRLIIMSRWGEQIFTSKDVNIGWDGYVNGKLVPQGVYVWRATGTFVNGKPFDVRGTVTLIR